MRSSGPSGAGWVAAGVRATAMSRRRLGSAGARRLAALPDLSTAVEALSISPYGQNVRPGQRLEEVQRGVSATVLWHLRILAGWAPLGDARIVRVLAGGFEVANIEDHLQGLAGGPAAPAAPAYRLGSLNSLGGRIASARSVPDVRALLAHSAWGDVGEDTPAAIHLGLRLTWAARVAAAIPGARPWAAGAAALVVARELIAAGRHPAPGAVRQATPLLGAAWVTHTGTVTDLAGSLPRDARWALADTADISELWRAEAAWWARVETDGFALLRRPVTTPDPVIGAIAVLAADAWRVRAALEVAARGGEGTTAMEGFDAVA